MGRMGRTARTLLAGATLAVLGCALPAGLARPADAAARAPAAPSRTVHLGAARPAPAARAPVRTLVNKSAGRQLITVTAASGRATTAVFRAYLVIGGRRVLVFGPWTAHVGYNGIAPPGRKREGDGRTPSGTYGFSFFFGVDPSPGVAFPYRRVATSDYWDDDPASARYNTWVDARTASAGQRPEPMHQVPAYDYGAVIAYNTARAPGLGSAIFLHVTTGGATAGCVSLPESQLLTVLRWLRPANKPLISITAA
jgi:L,D-peptidoglycan transpeptidase YkuD (ErfK/YbiS/YcfS/YnhG family)